VKSFQLQVFNITHQISHSGQRSTSIGLSARNNEPDGVIATGVVTALVSHDPALDRLIGCYVNVHIEEPAS
jgi:hypothetical protein